MVSIARPVNTHQICEWQLHDALGPAPNCDSIAVIKVTLHQSSIGPTPAPDQGCVEYGIFASLSFNQLVTQMEQTPRPYIRLRLWPNSSQLVESKPTVNVPDKGHSVAGNYLLC